MRYQKFETDSCCPGGRHYSITINIEADTTRIGPKVIVGKCTECNRGNAMLVDDSTIQAEGLRKTSKNSGRSSSKTSKKLANRVLKRPKRALDIAV